MKIFDIARLVFGSRWQAVVAIAIGGLSGLLASGLRAAPPEGPAGIFVIGDTRPVPNEVTKFNLDFVTGYTLRIPWPDLESWDAGAKSARYDFARVDRVLEEARALGKRVTMEIFIDKVPAHVLAKPGVVTWNNPHPRRGGPQVVPWDAVAMAAYKAMINALAEHRVAGTSWTVAEHPALQTLDAPIVGLQGLRELSNTLVHHPDYTRERFIQSVVDAVSANRRAFAKKYGFLAMFAMSDDQASPALDAAVMKRLDAEFNGPGKPSLGYFQETLSDAGPRPDAPLGKMVASAAPRTYLLFQALRPWTLRDGQERPEQIASGTPVTGIKFAWENYGATYVEIYGADVLNPKNAEGLRAWDRFLKSVAAGRGGRVKPGQPGVKPPSLP